MSALQGEGRAIIEQLQQEMAEAAEALNFERAAMLRDRVQALERATTRQTMIGQPDAQYDVIALAQAEPDALAQMFIIRNGLMLASESFPLEHAENEAPAAILASFMQQYYATAESLPPEIILPIAPEEADLLQTWLTSKRDGHKVKLTVPQRGEKRRLVERAAETAREQLALLQAQWFADTHRQERALQELQTELGLKDPPNRIECFDVSTLQGTASVASRVVFVQGVPRKSEYRRFNIKNIPHEGPDDFASMKEALARRFKRYLAALEVDEELPGSLAEKDETWRLLPDLLLIDGGKGQLNAALEVLESFNLREHVPIASLAKRLEEVFV
ncbi:MAG: excinuclease ABC subunit C, partial [Anaerolineae bacterium]|nr:excinuclease ABC subunit C [Anaerolineae bacterium]